MVAFLSELICLSLQNLTAAAQKYRKVSPVEHVLLRPDSHVGSTLLTDERVRSNLHCFFFEERLKRCWFLEWENYIRSFFVEFFLFPESFASVWNYCRKKFKNLMFHFGWDGLFWTKLLDAWIQLIFQLKVWLHEIEMVLASFAALGER